MHTWLLHANNCWSFIFHTNSKKKKIWHFYGLCHRIGDETISKSKGVVSQEMWHFLVPAFCWSKKGGEQFFLFSSIFYSNRRVVHSAISCSSKKPYYYFLYTHIIFFFFLLHHFLESIYFWQIYDILLRAIEFFCVKGSPTKVIYQKKTRENDEKSLLDFRVCFRSIVFSWCWQFKSARSFC